MEAQMGTAVSHTVSLLAPSAWQGCAEEAQWGSDRQTNTGRLDGFKSLSSFLSLSWQPSQLGNSGPSCPLDGAAGGGWLKGTGDFAGSSSAFPSLPPPPSLHSLTPVVFLLYCGFLVKSDSGTLQEGWGRGDANQ